MLKLWPLKLMPYGEHGLQATAKVMLKSIKGRADVSFFFTEAQLSSWPAKIAEIRYDVELKYGNVGYV